MVRIRLCGSPVSLNTLTLSCLNRYRQPLNDFRTELDGPEADLASPQFMQSVLQNQRMAFESSPAGHMDTFESPVLLIHGDSDDEVDFEESIGEYGDVGPL